ncbi:zinc finger protein 408 [Nematolebias whitei]|uniref:zinc finger protein 408 n=1 Tax=Nematolebias whitei TaxID=451745 RepID=UPI0018995B91|nr:zinc finger protein 408 [Nematolebias whitei]
MGTSDPRDLERSMAHFLPAVPSNLTSFLHSVLPCGFALGPSLFSKGSLGLWWVGHPLEAGTLLCTDADPDQASNNCSDPVLKGTSVNQALVQKAICIKFAHQARSLAQRNVTILCACGEVCEAECVHVCLRACRNIQPGTELLLYNEGKGQISDEPGDAIGHSEDTVAQKKGPEDVENNKINSPEREKEKTQEVEEELQQTHSFINRSCSPSQRSNVKTILHDPSPDCDRQLDSPTETAAGGHSDGVSAAVDVEDRDTDSSCLPAPPHIRFSSRLAAKPRRVHSLPSRVRLSAQSQSPKQIDGRIKDSADSWGTSYTDAESITTLRSAEGEPGWQPEVRERRYRCSSCDKKFYQISHLKKHQFSHTDEKPFTCQDCGKNYTSAESFRAHQMSHRGERPFSCPHCEKTYGLKRDLKEHLVLHTGEKPYTCEHCGKSFTRRPSLRVHRLLHCSRVVHMQSPKVQCTICSKLLANRNSLRLHMKLHTGEKPHVCQHCGKCFRQKGNLESHLRTHSGEKPFPCPECKQAFTQKPDLQRHMFSHTGGGFLCSYCGKSLRDPHSLRYHERLHTGERPHHCSLCGKGYTLATKLRRHMRSSHLKEKLYSCSCGASYTVKQSLLRHQAQHRTVKGAQMEAGGPRDEAEQESEAPGCSHSKPVRGRPKKYPLLRASEGRDRGEVKQRGEQDKHTEKFNSIEMLTGGAEEAQSDVQHAVVYVHTDDFSAPTSTPLLLAADCSLPDGTEPELMEVVISDGAEQCIVVRGQQAVGELLILQEEESGFCTVAQTVEINTV